MAIPNPKGVSNNVSEGDDASLRSLSSEDVSQAPRGYCCAKSNNPADGRGRKLHLLQMLVLPFIPILALIIQTSVLLNNIMVTRNEVMEINNQVLGGFNFPLSSFIVYLFTSWYTAGTVEDYFNNKKDKHFTFWSQLNHMVHIVNGTVNCPGVLHNVQRFAKFQVTIATELGKVVTRMQLERSEVAFYVYTNGSLLRTNLTKRFELTDEALRNMSSWPPVSLTFEGNKIPYMDKESFQRNLTTFRENVINSEDSSIKDVVSWYTSLNAALLEHLTQQIKENDNSGVWRYLLAFKNLLKSIESTGIAMVYGVNYFGQGFLQQQNYIYFITHDAIAKDLLNTSLNYVSQMKQDYQELTLNMEHYGDIKRKNDIITKNKLRLPNYAEALEYFDMMATYTDQLRKIQRSLRVLIQYYVDENLQNSANTEAMGIAILVLVLSVSPVIIWLVRNAVATIQLYAANLAKKAKELKREKKKSDLLLFQMLPPSVATQLKQTRQVPAEYYASVTVYFSDIVGFTEIAAVSTPLEVVTFLNKIYKQFDARIECYDVYKVETIGDSYMVASGLPVQNGNKHITEIASMALDLLAGSRQFKIPHRKSERLQIRSGAHTGPVVAGIVGSKMPRYCLFGDTVNTASRMESTGEASKIHISLEMKKALDVIGGYRTEHRGLVDVKGKGLMDTYWLTCKEGGHTRTVEMEAPSYFQEEDEDLEPVFIKRLRNESYF